MAASPDAPQDFVTRYPSHASSSTLNSLKHGIAASPDHENSEQTRNGNSPETSEDHARAGEHAHHEHPLTGGNIERHGPGSRRKKTRRSGGFLLEDNFDAEPEPELQPTQRDTKGKRKQGDAAQSTWKRMANHYRHGRDPSEGSSSSSQYKPGSSPSPGDAQAKVDRPDNNSTHGDTSRTSWDSIGQDGPSRGSADSRDGATLSQGGGIDPTQIVSMALNLSESRRRHLSAGYLAVPPVANGRRVTSAGPAPGSAGLQGSYANYGAGGSLRQHLQQQRRISRNLSPSHARSSPSSRHASSTHESSGFASPALPYEHDLIPEIHISPATLARAAKARQYIELSVEFRRLLRFLPPLVPDSEAPGNHLTATTSIPGTANYQITRTPLYANKKHALGRVYNPLQAIRNRKLRARTRRSGEVDTEQWDDIEKIKIWLAGVEEASGLPDYRQEDQVALPRCDGHLECVETPQASLGHRKNESSISKQKRPRMDWFVSPCELFADSYWIEQGDNKRLIEDRYGNRIFPPKPRSEPIHQRASLEAPKQHRKKRSFAGSATLSVDMDVDSEHSGRRSSERGRKGRHSSHQDEDREESPSKLKQVWRKARAPSTSSSGLSSSDDDDRTKRKRTLRRRVTSENIGPLERHLDNMLSVETANGNSVSPDLRSPGTPDKWGTGETGLDSQVKGVDGVKKAPAKAPLALQETSTPPSPKTKKFPHILHRPKKRGSSTDEQNSTGPNSPVAASFGHDVGNVHSPPQSRASSLPRESKKVPLPFFHSNGSKDHKKTHLQDPAVAGSDRDSTRQTNGSSSPPRTSLDRPRSPLPGGEKAGMQKGNSSMSSLPGKQDNRTRANTKDMKEPPSAVSRFFKGGRIGELVRSEGAKVGDFIFKKDPPPEEDSDANDSELSHESDTTEDGNDPVQTSKITTLSRISTGLSMNRSIGGDRQKSDRPRYHLNNLPAFKSTQQPNSQDTFDHISRQQIQNRKTRSPRFDQLAPPKMDLARITSSTGVSRTDTQSSDAELSRTDSGALTPSKSRSDSRLRRVLGSPGHWGRVDLPVTALASIPGKRNLSPSPNRMPMPEPKRHWSIGDRRSAVSEAQSQTRSGASLTKPSTTGAKMAQAAELARIRALFLCSGVKAHTIAERAYTVRPGFPPDFLRKAADIAGKELTPVIRKDEHVLAARMIVGELAKETDRIHASADGLRQKTVVSLFDRLNALKMKVDARRLDSEGKSTTSPEINADGEDDSLTGLTTRLSVSADAVLQDVTTRYTLEISQLGNTIEGLIRARRRRGRWLRRTGFLLLEWTLLGVMWWVWLVVMITRQFLKSAARYSTHGSIAAGRRVAQPPPPPLVDFQLKMASGAPSDGHMPSSFDSSDFHETSRLKRFLRRAREEPLIPLGCALTSWALLEATRSIRSGDKDRTNRMFRRRIYAQGFTLLAMLGGSIYWKRDREKQKEFEGLVSEKKKAEKLQRWLKELEARDEEEKEILRRREAIMGEAREARARNGTGEVRSVVEQCEERRLVPGLGILPAVEKMLRRR
ncbi:hypothetical protein K402DRAFT_401071 [Aulographum hederae CBS 113979]|uniref:HIG1 domain-containing protein n=1 Tax=Aulographum hederae CBS 113979 TaxID=1176131 RepID=A0A6G1HAG7_9PEZI|nr:hypothetical protein K402DRAFT_401071 [Aulographum hederae CBS 113979]